MITRMVAAPSRAYLLSAPAGHQCQLMGPFPLGCQNHIELKSAAFWAKELGQSETAVLASHRISLWDSPEQSRIVGKMIPGSRAIVIESNADAFRVKSPLDQSVGWVKSLQIERTLRQDATTRTPCQ
jgi:hypothetical protein